jgi:hypothetical protein
MTYVDRDAPWNRTYCYSRLNIRRFTAAARGYSIHQKINLNYNIVTKVHSKVEYLRSKERDCVLYADPFELIHPSYRGVVHILDRNHFPIWKDTCEACKQKTGSNCFPHDTSICSKCESFKFRYQKRTGDKTIEGWLSWSLSTETAYKKYIRKLGEKNDK